MTRDQLVDFFRHLHEVFRIHDDPWFNEHYPAAVPLVCSESIWQKNLELWDNYQHYWNYHPGQLLGQDPPVVGAPATTTLTEGDQRMIVDGERAAISRFAHQVLMERSRPALFDLLTLYLPRFFLRRSFNACPSSNEEAIAWYQKFFPTEQTSISTKIFAKYRLKDIDALLREVPIELFDEVAPRLLNLISDPPESSELEKLSA